MLSEFVSDQVRFQEMAGLVLDSLPDWVDAEHPPDEQGAHRPIASDEQSGDGAEVHDDLVGSDASFVDTDGAAGLVQQKASYSVFSSALDETGPARRWLTANDHALLSLLDSPDRLRIQHLARELQRHLLAQARPSWAFDCDEGVLDSRRLSRLVTSASDRRVFRQEIGREKSEACVCFLIDLSGSMSHERRVMAALTLDFVLQTLDQCSISSEALAFTTRFFAPNPLADEWRRRGEPTRPGRLNAVRHVVLKAKHEGWKATRNALALLLKKDFGRENLDGEALDWAARRLSRSPERKKFLIVFSDGEPYDEATDLANGSLYLEDHLREVIKAVEASGIVLSAIGFGSNVTRFFGNAITVRRAEDLPSKVFDRVGELLMPRFKGAIRP
ncbi:MAG: cobaltochelatase CobT-related protein [Wenzhouxiangella sp.]